MPVVNQLKFVQIDSVDRLSGPFSRLFRPMQNPVQAGSKKNRRSFLNAELGGATNQGLSPIDLSQHGKTIKTGLAPNYITALEVLG